MANRSPTEITLMKGVSVKLDKGLLFTLAYFVHTEKGHRDQSEYLYAGRIDKAEDLAKEAEELNSDQQKLKNWTWPGLPKYDCVEYNKFYTNGNGSKWYKNKIRKAVDWPTFLKIASGWQESKKAYNDNAKYPLDDYLTEDGVQIKNLSEAKAILETLAGKTVLHKNIMKSQLPA